MLALSIPFPPWLSPEAEPAALENWCEETRLAHLAMLEKPPLTEKLLAYREVDQTVLARCNEELKTAYFACQQAVTTHQPSEVQKAAVHRTTCALATFIRSVIVQPLQKLEARIEEAIEGPTARRHHSLGEQPDEPPADGTTSRPRGTVNQRMLEECHQNPQSLGWTQRQWAAFLGCSASAVAVAPCWTTIKTARAVAAVDRLDRDPK
jgi:hypothetical protein